MNESRLGAFVFCFEVVGQILKFAVQKFAERLDLPDEKSWFFPAFLPIPDRVISDSESICYCLLSDTCSFPEIHKRRPNIFI